MVNANDFFGKSDSEIIANAIAAKDADGIVVIPPRSAVLSPKRDFWLLDSAVILPENTTLILRDCTLKLSDNCRDNFIRSANAGLGIEDPSPISNIHITGEGRATLVGADHPRATGDSSKLLKRPSPHKDEDVIAYADWIPAERRVPGKVDFWDVHDYSYGTDVGKKGESQYGDWRGIGILFANVSDFSIEGIRIVDSHGWGISLEGCSYGSVRSIDFDMRMSKMIDGVLQNLENQDGIDLRNGCHDITVSDISGRTGDDVIALTAIADPDYLPGGSLRTTHVMHNDWARRERDIYNIIIRNVRAYSNLCFTVRLLPAMSQIRNVIIDGVVDTSPDGHTHFGCILLGDLDGYGKNLVDSLKNITVSNVISKCERAVSIEGYLTDSVISNVINSNPSGEAVVVKRTDGLKNVLMTNILSTNKS